MAAAESSSSPSLVDRVRDTVRANLGDRGPQVGAGVAAALAIVLVSAFLDVNLFSVVINGTQLGVVYALVAVGIALVYKSTKVLNFAQGEIGTIAAFTVFMGLSSFTVDATLETSYPFHEMVGWTLLAILIGAVVAVLINIGVVSRLANAAPVTTLVATIGVSLLFIGSQVLYFDALPRPFPKFTEGTPPGLDLGPLCLSTRSPEGACLGTEGGLVFGGANITYQFLLTAIVLAAVAFGLAAFFRTQVGVALLASSQEPYAAQLQGVSLQAMSALAWGTAGAFGALAGVLAGGTQETIFPGFMTSTVLIPAIVAAVLGGITSIPGAVVGAVLLGLVQAYANAAVLAQSWSIPGPPQLATFGVLLLVLLVRPRGLLGKEA